MHVFCRNTDPGREVRQVCQVGCIGCRRCEKECKFDAIRVEENLARIDYEKCTSCGRCAQVCPVDAIVNFRKARKELQAARAAGGEG